MKLILAFLNILAIISTKVSAFVPSQSVGNFVRTASSSQNDDLNMSLSQQDISKCISECNVLAADVFQDSSICEKAKEDFPDRRSLLQCKQGTELASLYACNALCESDRMKSHLISVSVAKECNRRIGAGPKSRLKAALTGSNIVESPKDDHDVQVNLPVEDMKKEVTVAVANIGVEKVEKDATEKPKLPSTIELEDLSMKESTNDAEEDTVEKSEQGISLDQDDASQEFVDLPTLTKLLDASYYSVSHAEEKNPLAGVNVTSSLNWTVPPAFVGSTIRDYNRSSNERNDALFLNHDSIRAESVMVESQNVWLLNHSKYSATSLFLTPPPWSSLFEGGIGQDIGAFSHPVDLLSNASAFCNSSAINFLSRDSLVPSSSEEAEHFLFEEGCNGSHVLLPANVWSTNIWSMRSSSRHWLLGFGGASPNKGSTSSYDDGPNHLWSQVDCSPVAKALLNSPTWCNVVVPRRGMRQFIAPADQPPTNIRPAFEAKGLVEIRKVSLALLLAALACYNDFFGSTNQSTTSNDDSAELFLGCDNDVEDSPADDMKQLRIQTTKPRCLLSSDLSGPYWNSALPDSRYRRRSLRQSQPPDRFIPSF